MVEIQDLLEEIPKDDIKSTPSESTFHHAIPSNRNPRLIQNQQRNDLTGILLAKKVRQLKTYETSLKIVHDRLLSAIPKFNLLDSLFQIMIFK